MTEGFPRGAENCILFLALIASTSIPPVVLNKITGTPQPKRQSFGDWSDGGTPGYISNPVVKPVSADGTRSADSRESRSSPKDFFVLIPKAVNSVPSP